jgi:MOSC domain-containing protein YiiM
MQYVKGSGACDHRLVQPRSVDDSRPAGTLASINISRGGPLKQTVFEALITRAGVAGDHQNDPRHHGGPDRAVVLFSLDRIRQLQEEGHSIAVGTIGENLTLSGLDWSRVVPGVELTIGPVSLVVTRYADPCSKIGGAFASRNYARVSQARHPGWSRVCARVIKEGVVRPGDAVAAILL